jgi:uncharacterized membrane protein YqjE
MIGLLLVFAVFALGCGFTAVLVVLDDQVRYNAKARAIEADAERDRELGVWNGTKALPATRFHCVTRREP